MAFFTCSLSINFDTLLSVTIEKLKDLSSFMFSLILHILGWVVLSNGTPFLLMSSVVAHLNDNFYRDFPRFPRPDIWSNDLFSGVTMDTVYNVSRFLMT